MSRVHYYDSIAFGGATWPVKGRATEVEPDAPHVPRPPSGTITFSLTFTDEDCRAFEEHVHAGWAVVLFLAWVCRGCPVDRSHHELER